MEPTFENVSQTSATLNFHSGNLTMDKLYEQRSVTGDIKFIIESEEIRAHRNVLAARSPKYMAQFYGGMAEKDVVYVQGVTPAAFSQFIRFFYKGKLTLSIDNVDEVLNLAKQSLVDDLVNGCVNFLKKMMSMDEEKLLWCYGLAIQYELKELEKICESHIKANVSSVFRSSDFSICERVILCRILALESISCSETKIFNGCISWAQHQCEENGLDITNTRNLRAALGDAFYRIRFCSMTSEEFATILKRFPRFFSPEEAFDVLKTIALKSKGATSNIFDGNNSKSRGWIQPPILECLFRKGSPISIGTSYPSIYLNFTCDKAINLNGFIMHNRIDGDIELIVKTESKWGHEMTHTKTFLANTTKITFTNAIELKNDEWCSIHVKIVRSVQSNTNLKGFKAKDVVEQNGVSFRIDYSDHVKLITSLLFFK